MGKHNLPQGCVEETDGQVQQWYELRAGAPQKCRETMPCTSPWGYTASLATFFAHC